MTFVTVREILVLLEVPGGRIGENAEIPSSVDSLLTVARDENRRRKTELFRPKIRAKTKGAIPRSFLAD